MQERKIDRRVIRTRESIRRAFRALIHEKEYSKITVSDIANYAGINRRTFYLHYSSVEDVLLEFEKEAVDRVRSFSCYVDLLDESTDLTAMFYHLTSMILEENDLIKRLIHAKSYHFFFDHLKNIWRDALVERYSPELNMTREEFFLYTEWLTSAILSVYVQGLVLDNGCNADEVTHIVIRMTNSWRDEVLHHIHEH